MNYNNLLKAHLRFGTTDEDIRKNKVMNKYLKMLLLLLGGNIQCLII